MARDRATIDIMVDLLRAGLLIRHGFRHGFTLRTGGVSEPPFASANLGRSVGDAPAHVAMNHLALAWALPFSASGLYEVSQVHGSVVRMVEPDEAPADVRRDRADALVGRGPGLALGVRVADCGSVLLAYRRTGAVAGVHAGWGGAV
jgi:copper oxidase (laccase) domain-containing protein